MPINAKRIKTSEASCSCCLNKREDMTALTEVHLVTYGSDHKMYLCDLCAAEILRVVSNAITSKGKIEYSNDYADLKEEVESKDDEWGEDDGEAPFDSEENAGDEWGEEESEDSDSDWGDGESEDSEDAGEEDDWGEETEEADEESDDEWGEDDDSESDGAEDTDEEDEWEC